jgi:hypothetical protein
MILKFYEKYGKKWNASVKDISIAGIEGEGRLTTKDINENEDDAGQKYYTISGSGLGAYETEAEAKAAIDEYNQSIKGKEQQSISITPEMRESVLYEGQPLFLQKDVYAEAIASKPGIIEKLTNSNKSFKETKDRVAADIFVPASTRLKGLGEQLFDEFGIMSEFSDKLRKFEYATGIRGTEDTKACMPFLQAIKKMEPDDRVVLDRALKNGNAEKTAGIVNKYKLEREYQAVRDVLDRIHGRAVSSGFDVNYVKEYWPRLVINTDGLLKAVSDLPEWGIIEQQIAKEEAAAGRPLSERERANIANSYISRPDRIIQSVGSIKERSITLIDNKLDKFYDYSSSALVSYLHEMNQAIETRKFFGMDKKKEAGAEGEMISDIEASIGEYVLNAVKEGRLNPQQQDELIGVLKARFNYRPSKKVIQTIKNAGYITSMGSGFSSCFTQFGDFT